jgi:hypothetical protein
VIYAVKYLTFALCLLTFDLAAVAAQPRTPSEIEAFMRAAKVTRTRELSTGITRPLRLTLSDGAFTHDAVFQRVDEKKVMFVPTKGRTEINFVDSWRYNVAAYRLSGLLGLDRMMPVTIGYEYQGRHGSLSWWMDSLMDERRRLKEKVQPPDVLAWNQDMYRMRLFMSLVHDTDRNLGNVLVSPSWGVIMLDFTRAFRLHQEIQTKEIHQCDRQLWTRLQELSGTAVDAAVGEYLTSYEKSALLKRRELLVSHIQQLIAARGEEKVLY